MNINKCGLVLPLLLNLIYILIFSVQSSLAQSSKSTIPPVGSTANQEVSVNKNSKPIPIIESTKMKQGNGELSSWWIKGRTKTDSYGNVSVSTGTVIELEYKDVIVQSTSNETVKFDLLKFKRIYKKNNKFTHELIDVQGLQLMTGPNQVTYEGNISLDILKEETRNPTLKILLTTDGSKLFYAKINSPLNDDEEKIMHHIDTGSFKIIKSLDNDVVIISGPLKIRGDINLGKVILVPNYRMPKSNIES